MIVDIDEFQCLVPRVSLSSIAEMKAIEKPFTSLELVLLAMAVNLPLSKSSICHFLFDLCHLFLDLFPFESKCFLQVDDYQFSIL
jgi:hypothetical protein